VFTYKQQVLFKHCDPAGIVFYPRYFEMVNDVVEDFFDRALHYPFSEVIANNGIPTARISADFSAPSRLGDQLCITLRVTETGKSSIKLNFAAHCDDELRFSADAVLVYVDNNGKSTSLPDFIRQSLQVLIHGDKNDD